MRVEVTPERWRTEHRVVTTVLEPDGRTSTRARFVVEDGNPAAIQDGPLT